MLLALPKLRPLVPCKLKLAKIGLAAVLMSCTVLTLPEATLKLVALNEAIPLTVVLALSMVMLVAVVRALLNVTAPLAPAEPDVVPVMLEMPDVPPLPPLVKHVAQEI